MFHLFRVDLYIIVYRYLLNWHFSQLYRGSLALDLFLLTKWTAFKISSLLNNAVQIPFDVDMLFVKSVIFLATLMICFNCIFCFLGTCKRRTVKIFTINIQMSLLTCQLYVLSIFYILNDFLCIHSIPTRYLIFKIGEAIQIQIDMFFVAFCFCL